MLRDEQIAHEVETYNNLIPDTGELSATLMIELTSEPALREWLPRLVGIQQHVAIVLPDGTSVVGQLSEEDELRLTRDDITAVGREKLRAAGFAPPAPRPAQKLDLVQLQRGFRCPYCGSTETKLENLFGPTPCRSIRYCESCRQPFEQFKTL